MLSPQELLEEANNPDVLMPAIALFTMQKQEALKNAQQKPQVEEGTVFERTRDKYAAGITGADPMDEQLSPGQMSALQNGIAAPQMAPQAPMPQMGPQAPMMAAAGGLIPGYQEGALHPQDPEGMAQDAVERRDAPGLRKLISFFPALASKFARFLEGAEEGFQASTTGRETPGLQRGITEIGRRIDPYAGLSDEEMEAERQAGLEEWEIENQARRQAMRDRDRERREEVAERNRARRLRREGIETPELTELRTVDRGTERILDEMIPETSAALPRIEPPPPVVRPDALVPDWQQPGWTPPAREETEETERSERPVVRPDVLVPDWQRQGLPRTEDERVQDERAQDSPSQTGIRDMDELLLRSTAPEMEEIVARIDPEYVPVDPASVVEQYLGPSMRGLADYPRDARTRQELRDSGAGMIEGEYAASRNPFNISAERLARMTPEMRASVASGVLHQGDPIPRPEAPLLTEAEERERRRLANAVDEVNRRVSDGSALDIIGSLTGDPATDRRIMGIEAIGRELGTPSDADLTAWKTQEDLNKAGRERTEASYDKLSGFLGEMGELRLGRDDIDERMRIEEVDIAIDKLLDTSPGMDAFKGTGKRRWDAGEAVRLAAVATDEKLYGFMSSLEEKRNSSLRDLDVDTVERLKEIAKMPKENLMELLQLRENALNALDSRNHDMRMLKEEMQARMDQIYTASELEGEGSIGVGDFEKMLLVWNYAEQVVSEGLTSGKWDKETADAMNDWIFANKQKVVKDIMPDNPAIADHGVDIVQGAIDLARENQQGQEGPLRSSLDIL